MLDRLDDMLNFHAQALRLRGERQQVLASNIANADTPNYKARDMDFRAALTSAVNASANGQPLDATDPRHFAVATTPAGMTDSGVPLLYRNPLQDSVDGNTVNIDSERAAFAENAMRYEFNLTRLNSQLNSLKKAIEG